MDRQVAQHARPERRKERGLGVDGARRVDVAQVLAEHRFEERRVPLDHGVEALAVHGLDRIDSLGVVLRHRRGV